MNRKKNKGKFEVANLNGFFVGLAFLAGLSLGGLLGAGALLLMAPQSGKKTRRQLQRKGKKLREQTTDTIEDGVDQVRAKAQKVTDSIHDQSDALQKRGHNIVDNQKERLDTIVEAGKAAVNGS